VILRRIASILRHLDFVELFMSSPGSFQSHFTLVPDGFFEIENGKALELA
jgi:hypothetical protein